MTQPEQDPKPPVEEAAPSEPAAPAAEAPAALSQVTKAALVKGFQAGLVTAVVLGSFAAVGCALLTLAPAEDWLGRLIGDKAAARVEFICSYALVGLIAGWAFGFVVAWLSGWLKLRAGDASSGKSSK